MKLLTLNTHSHAEEDYPRKLAQLAEGLAVLRPEVIALQEVNQTQSAPPVREIPRDFLPAQEGTLLRCDNCALELVRRLGERGVRYHWTWLPIKTGYGRFDEGAAVLTSSPIIQTDVLTVSRTADYSDHRTRRIVGVRTEALPDEWFFSVHFGRWDDEQEPFRQQWIRTAEHISRYDSAWLMGDFNAPADVRGESYDLVARSFWQDSYLLAHSRDHGVTAGGAIDGWRDAPSAQNGMRIDQIWCNFSAVVTSSRVVFDGGEFPSVSDHRGVLIDYQRSIV